MNIYTQCCGVVLLVIMRYFYDKSRKIKVNTGRAFEILSSSVFFSLCLDIVSVILIYYMDRIPLWIVELVCKAYLCSLCWAGLMAFRYICVDIFSSDKDMKKWTFRITFLGIVILIIISILPISLHNEYRKIYSFGPSTIATYCLVTLIWVLITTMIVRHKKEINSRRRKGVSVLMYVWMLAAIIQFFFKNILIIGFASAIGVLIIYMILENPETRIDRSTGVFNLGAFLEYASQKMKRGKDMSIICITYDRMSESTLSMESDREVLQEVVYFLEEIPESEVFRSSTSEFIIVFSEKELAIEALEKIKNRFRIAWGTKSKRILSMDWYLIESTKHFENAEDIYLIFHSALIGMKELENSRGVIIDDTMIRKIYEDREMENEIIDAMQDDRVEVFYQPIFSIKEGMFTTAEALVRIRDTVGKLIPPGRFIEVAEKNGLIIQLGEIVFRKVCEFINYEKPGQYGIQYIEVNLSMVQCGYENLAEDFIRIMEETHVDPRKIVLEITESASIKEKKILLENMMKLREVGIKFALDDFGTGQSNLNYIVEMPIDVVKFDNTMINAYFENGTATYVMDAAMSMIHGLNLPIVSEGIEEEQQFAKMKKLGIDYIQGYYFSKPICKDEFVQFVKEKSGQK